MSTPLHLTSFGEASELSRSEVLSARARVAETIRHELDERHLAHWPRHRRTARRFAAARMVARRSRLVVVTDSDDADRRVIGAATVRRTSARFGRVALVPLAVLRHCTRSLVIFGSMVVLLAVRHGHTGLGALVTFGVLVGLGTAPVLSSLRIRLADRVVAARGQLFTGSDPSAALVLRHLGFPEDRTAAVAVVKALRSIEGWGARVAVPCCAEMAASYSSIEGVMWVPRHADTERSVLLFAPSTGARPPLADEPARATVRLLH